MIHKLNVNFVFKWVLAAYLQQVKGMLGNVGIKEVCVGIHRYNFDEEGKPSNLCFSEPVTENKSMEASLTALNSAS